jgi:hypothetical protein
MMRAACPCGGIGRRARLKIEFRKECWFDSGQGHHGSFDSLFPIRFSNNAVLARSNATIQTPLDKHWIASQSLSSGAHSRPSVRDDGIGPRLATEQANKKLSPGAKPRFSRPGSASSPEAVMLGFMPAGNSCFPAS